VDFLFSLILACGLVQPPAGAAPSPGSGASSVVEPAAPATGAADPAGVATASVGDEPSATVGPAAAAPWPGMAPFGSSTVAAAPQRPRAVEMSDAYHLRLTIHYVASFLTLPLFVTEYVLGTRLYRDPPGSRTLRQEHRLVALGVGGLFAVNTVTGVWNLWDSRHQPEGRLLRYLHSGMMLAADAGFVATGMVAPRGGRRAYLDTPARRRLHRTLALSSMGTALASYAMMLLWRH
jgi:hypothetical protein